MLKVALESRTRGRKYQTSITCTLETAKWHLQHGCNLQGRTYRIRDLETNEIYGKKKNGGTVNG